MTRPSFHLRLPYDMHDVLRQMADEQGISLNTLVVALLAAKLGWQPDVPTETTSERELREVFERHGLAEQDAEQS